MASNKPGTCCYQGVKHEGEAVGKIEQGDSFEYYVSEAKDKSTEKGVLMWVDVARQRSLIDSFSLTDVIGHKFINAQLIADQFAANG